jgi:hypothetical protein
MTFDWWEAKRRKDERAKRQLQKWLTDATEPQELRIEPKSSEESEIVDPFPDAVEDTSNILDVINQAFDRAAERYAQARHLTLQELADKPGCKDPLRHRMVDTVELLEFAE